MGKYLDALRRRENEKTPTHGTVETVEIDSHSLNSALPARFSVFKGGSDRCAGPPIMPDAKALASAKEGAAMIIANAKARAQHVPEFRPVPWPPKVKCGDCRHFSRLAHPRLGVCTHVDGRTYGVNTNWDTSPHICPQFEGRTGE